MGTGGSWAAAEGFGWTDTGLPLQTQNYTACPSALQVSTYQRRYGLPETPQHVVEATMAGT